MTRPKLTNLAELVTERKNALGFSYRHIGELAGLSGAAVHLIATGTEVKQVPKRSTVEGLARALEVDEDSIKAAIASDLGIREASAVTQKHERLVLLTQTLDEEELDVLLSLVDLMRRKRR